MTNILFTGAQETPYHKQRGTSKPVAKMKDGVIIKTYSSINEAARDNNIYSSNISDVIHGYHSQTHGYQWKYVGYDVPSDAKRKNRSKKKIESDRPCKVILEKAFQTKTSAQEFITNKNLSDAKIVFTRNRAKKQ